MKWLIWSVSGICFALVSVHQFFWWVFLPAFLLFLYNLTKSSSYQEVFVGGLLVGTLKCLGGYSWIWSTYPMNWALLSKASQIVFIGMYWFSTSVFMALGIATATVLLFLIWQKYKKFFLLTFPLVWLGGEVLGSLMVSIILLGPGAYLNINISYGYTGIALSNISLFYPFALLGGMHCLTLVSAFLGAFSYFIWNRNNWSWFKKFFWVGYGLTALLVIYILVPNTTVPVLGKTVVVVDTRFTPEMLSTEVGEKLKAEQELSAILLAAKAAPDIVLLPEDSRLTEYLGGEDRALELLDSKLESDPVVVDSGRVDVEGGAILRAFYHDLKNKSVYATDKQFLMPQGEYVTYPFIGLLLFLGFEEQLNKVLSNQNYKPGEISDFKQFPKDSASFMFCAESSSIFGLSRIGKLTESPLVLHAVSHARFHNPHIFWFQLDSAIRTQAINTKKIVVSSGNMSPSKIYTPDGRISRGKLILSTEFFDLIEYKL